MPGSAQGPAIVPDSSAKYAPIAAPLPEMEPSLETSSAPAGASETLPKALSAPEPAAAIKEESRISIEMRDAPVIDLLMLISAQGNVEISIGSDVEADLRIPGIRLNDVTAADAIRKAAMAANLRWKKLDETTFLVGKNLSSDAESLSDNSDGNRKSEDKPQSENKLQPKGIEPIDENWLQVRSQPLRDPMASLPSLHGPSTGYESGLVPLSRKAPSAEKVIRPIRIRNVRAGLIAWWLDPENQEMPIEMQASEQAKQRAINPYPLIPGADPNVMATLNGNSSPLVPFSNPYASGNNANPYINAGAGNPWAQPFYRSNFQFGRGSSSRGGFGGRGSSSMQGGLLELGTDDEGNQLVDQIVSIDAQNVLLVYGTEEGVRKLNQIIEYLDRPIRQVEIESQFIDISVSDAKAFGVQFYNRDSLVPRSGSSSSSNDERRRRDLVPLHPLGVLPAAEGVSSVIITRNNFQAKIQAMTNSGRARIINSPRVTTMNNLTASLVSQQQTPVVLTSSNTGIGGQVGQQQNAFFLTTAIGIQVTPTINNDDTITVFLTPQVSVQSQTPTFTSTDTSTGSDSTSDSNRNAAASIPTVSSQFVTTVANVKDNDVIVLGGLRTRTQNIAKSGIPVLSKLPIIGSLFRSTNVSDVDRELVIFLTARILRRSDDVTPIQGP